MSPPSQDTVVLHENAPTVGGRWELVSLLAEGGMGQVYVGRHMQTGKTAAVKVMRRDDPESRERFRLEAGVAATLGHPGIVDVFDADVDEISGRCFLAMELLDGRTLRDAMDDEEQTPASLLELLRQVLEPLSVAHDRGYVHRDLKPENVFVVAAGGQAQVKLLDFGIAGHALRKGLTLAGTAMGTPHYMSPEQAMDATQALPSADVWSFGVMLYEALSGEVPFSGDTSHAVVVRVCTEDPVPLDSVSEGVSTELNALVMSCLHKDPARRPQNAGVLRSQLLPLLHPESIPAHRSPSRGSLRQPDPSQTLEIEVSAPHSGPDSMLSLVLTTMGVTWMLGGLGAYFLGLIGVSPLLLVSVCGAGLLTVGVVRRAPPPRAPAAVRSPPARTREQAPREPRPTTQSATTPSKGPANARVTLALYGDLCTYATRRLLAQVLELQRAHAQEVRLQLYLLPFKDGEDSWAAAETADAVWQAQGNTAFWCWVESALKIERKLKEEDFAKLAADVGMDMGELRHLRRGRRNRPALIERRNKARSETFDLDPYLSLNGVAVTNQSSNELWWTLQDALQAARSGGNGRLAATKVQAVSDARLSSHMDLCRIVVAFRGARHADESIQRSRADAQVRAEKVRARALMPKTDFEALAVRFSDSSHTLGYISLGELSPPLAENAAQLRVGDIGEVVEDTDGFHILHRLR